MLIHEIASKRLIELNILAAPCVPFSSLRCLAVGAVRTKGRGALGKVSFLSSHCCMRLAIIRAALSLLPSNTRCLSPTIFTFISGSADRSSLITESAPMSKSAFPSTSFVGMCLLRSSSRAVMLILPCLRGSYLWKGVYYALFIIRYWLNVALFQYVQMLHGAAQM